MIKTRKFKKKKFNKLSRRAKKYKRRLAKRTRQKYSKREKRRWRSRKMRGGKAIAAGSVGCIFKPAFKCSRRDDDKNYDAFVSKLMIKSEADKEIKEVEAIADVLAEVGEQYFIIARDKDKCNLDYSLNEKDLVDMNSKEVCKNIFAKADMWEKFSLLNMPYGGINLQKWLETTDVGGMLSREKFIEINEKLICLLKNAIIPMNEKGVLHLDLKPQNLVYDESIVRIIDWGYARNFNRDNIISNETIPEMYTDKLYYGVPFGFLIFYPEIFTKEMRKYDFKYLTDLHEYLGKDDDKLNNIINEYLDAIRAKYEPEESYKYFNDVFSKNADIWGVIHIYLCMYSLILDPDIKVHIEKLVQKYILNSEWATKPYDLEEIIGDLSF